MESPVTLSRQDIAISKAIELNILSPVSQGPKEEKFELIKALYVLNFADFLQVD
jgi:hypothetical protein